jgi:hypothetical protein
MIARTTRITTHMLRRRFLVLALLCCVAAWLWVLKLQSGSLEEPYTQIEDGLYVGAAVPEPPPGTRAVVNLCYQKDHYQVESCLWDPILDAGRAPDLVWLRRVVEFIDSQRRDGSTTYIHCIAGVSRSGMVATAYLMYRNGWERDTALAFVRSKRPQIEPNAAFLQLLREWKEALKAPSARTDLSSGGDVVLKR